MSFKIQNYITINFNWKSSIYFLLAFVLFTPLGTVSHEAGHYLVAQRYFKKPTLHYGYVNYGEWKQQPEMNKWYSQHSDSDGQVYEEDIQTLEIYRKKAQRHGLYSTLAGPSQTMLFGTIGFLLLYFNNSDKFKFKNWIAVYLAYFWSREVFIFLSLVITRLLTGQIPLQSDEVVIAYYLKIPLLLPAAIFGLLGIIVLTYTTFNKIPIEHRFTFIISGIVGSFIGFILWLRFLGPIIMP
ncbi:hypothetical protein [Nonlabens sp. Asnod2-A12]|uniref:hypothetical protein n=1 Tax=Nonlabens sp. Asnod2-A12 TaxID=3160578 RepID=UPI003862FB8B